MRTWMMTLSLLALPFASVAHADPAPARKAPVLVYQPAATPAPAPQKPRLVLELVAPAPSTVAAGRVVLPEAPASANVAGTVGVTIAHF